MPPAERFSTPVCLRSEHVWYNVPFELIFDFTKSHILIVSLWSFCDRFSVCQKQSSYTIITYQSRLVKRSHDLFLHIHKEHQENGAKKGGKSWQEMQLIRSLTQHLSGHGGIRVSGTAAGGGEWGRDSLLSSDLSGFEPGDKIFDCLVLEVGAHIARESPISVTLFCHSENTNRLSEHDGNISDY